MKASVLIAILIAPAIGSAEIGERAPDEYQRGNHPRECLLDWDNRLHNPRSTNSDPEKLHAENVVFDVPENTDVGLLHQFMEVNGWVRVVDFDNPQSLIFSPPYMSKGLFIDWEREDTTFGLLIPCQAAWLSGARLRKVFRRFRGDHGDLAYELEVP